MAADKRLPLLIPSYNRYPEPPLVKIAKHCLGDEYPWFVFVRKSQAKLYTGVPKNHLIAVPDRLIPNVGSVRNYVWQWAYERGYDFAFEWDDDVKGIGRKIADGRKYIGYRSTGNTDPWLDGPGFWEEAGRLSRETFRLYPNTVAGSIQNQRWPSTETVKIQHGKTPRRAKILNLKRIVENNLWVPEEFMEHGDDIGSAALWLENGWQVFTICSLVYDFTPETDIKLPSTLRDRDEDKNRAIHEQEFTDLQKFEIGDYMRVTKRYDDGAYMYGDIDWRKFRKVTGQVSYTHEFSPIRKRVPLDRIPCTIIE